MMVVTLAKSPLGAQPMVERDSAWRVIYDENFERVYALIVRFGVSPGEAEDLAQATFLRAYQRLAQGARVEQVGPWLRGIAVRVVAERRRWNRVRRVKNWVLRVEDEIAAGAAPTPEQDAAESELRREVAQILERMSSKYSSVLVLLEIEQCTPEEAAAILGVPTNTVRSRRDRARKKFEWLWSRRRGAARTS